LLSTNGHFCAVFPGQRTSACAAYRSLEFMIHQKAMNHADISGLLTPFGIQPTEEQSIQIGEYVELLLRWNQSLNLTSILDPQEIVSRHFGESMLLCNVLPVENCRLADVGSGAGFPGLAIKIIRPGVQLTLIESSQKKCAFLSEVVRTLGLSRIEILRSRFEEVRMAPRSIDILTARAIGGWPRLLGWVRTLVNPGGHIALWVGGQDSIKIAATPGWLWNPAVRIPESQRRYLLLGRPSRTSA
jgi:16S rRNA (guanine527-N7)-methyltransferase